MVLDCLCCKKNSALQLKTEIVYFNFISLAKSLSRKER
jgi:hypothetical protein